jgi:hypothetical protein
VVDAARARVTAVLDVLAGGAPLAEVLGVFDELPGVDVRDVLGRWHGSEVPTGHPLDGLLAASGWHGKRFDGPDDAHPLVFARADGRRFAVNPAVVPVGLLVRRPALARHPLAVRAFTAIAPLLATRRPRARLRMTEHRGVVTATMVYDALPILDVFRRLDDDVLLGLMDLRGVPDPYAFLLRREGSS